MNFPVGRKVANTRRCAEVPQRSRAGIYTKYISIDAVLSLDRFCKQRYIVT